MPVKDEKIGMSSQVVQGRGRWKKPLAIILGTVLIVGLIIGLYVLQTRPSLIISLDKTSSQIQRGTFQSVQISVTSSISGSGVVSLSLSQLPADVTARFSNPDPILSGGITKSNLTITAGPHAYGQNSTLTITAATNGFTTQASLPISIVGNTYGYNLAGSYAGGWNTTTIGVTEGDVLVLHLTSKDSLTHALFIDYNGNMLPDANEPLSPVFSSSTVPVPFTLWIVQTGNFNYYCKYHPNMMGTLHSAAP